ncbi:hypothetical protein GTW51_13760 [Aurantimonas aggregata]|uniref:Uncharacterized protein n=1 Tax=Aurantimonas aggregata TaxID=2047720 RepID=A0A6L9MJG3_9HYPH|nr:DUF6107 family protein [Aurantimonas aggregata]NDV87768.1 hypothetical protein [Aurantimonas aggregata]
MSAEPATDLALWLAKLVGAIAGSAISVAYLLPRGPREAATRFLTGIVSGLVFGPPVALILAERMRIDDSLSAIELALIGSAVASLCAWWGLGVLQRFAESLFRARPGSGGGDK